MNDLTRNPIDFCFRGILRGASFLIVAPQSDPPAPWPSS